MLGRHVQTLVNKEQQPERYVIQFNAGELVSGVYVYRLQAGSFVSVKN